MGYDEQMLGYGFNSFSAFLPRIISFSVSDKPLERFEALDNVLLIVPRAVGREKHLIRAVVLDHSNDILIGRCAEMPISLNEQLMSI